MKFNGTLILGGKTATGIEVPAEIVTALGAGKRPPVRVTIRHYTYRTTVAPMGGAFYIGVSADIRQQTGLAAGDEVEVEIELDTDPRVVAVPDDFQAALNGEPQANAFFAGLSYSNKRRIVMGIEDAKTPETRQRRIEKAINALREKKI